MKLQAAYASEKSEYGGWKLIGYSGPGTNQSNAESSSTTTFTYGGGIGFESNTSDGATGWTATNKAKLNDCAGGVANWTVATIAIANGVDSYNATTNCPELTANFEAIGK